ncbi:MAG: RNA-binding protein [Candidatus Micrarchaeota archaeon]
MAEIHVPGDLLYSEPKHFIGAFVDKNSTFASLICTKYDDKVVPLKGKYLPVVQDYVVGIVKDVRFSGYTVDMNSPYDGQLSARESRENFQIGDVISALIQDVDEVNEPMLVEPRKLFGGRLLEVESVKIPRIIGRNSSMVSMIEKYSRSKLFVGKNGRIYIKEGNLPLAVRSILKIEKEAHLHGLTDRMQAFLEAESKNSKP